MAPSLARARLLLLLAAGVAVDGAADGAAARRTRLPTGPYTDQGAVSRFTPGKLGAVTKAAAAADGSVELTCGAGDLVKVSFHSPTAVRIWLGTQDPKSGRMDNFTDPAGGEGSPG
eukprot:SAG22_NODE_411_length_10900_cov_2.633738_3_plen_116_part_00